MRLPFYKHHHFAAHSAKVQTTMRLSCQFFG